MSFITFKRAKERLAAGKVVAIDFYSKATGKQTRMRVVKIVRSPMGFAVKSINGELSECLTHDRVVWSDG